MKKSKLTRTLMAACSVVALSAVMYGCVHSGDDPAPPVVEPEPDPVDVDTKKINDAIDAATAAIGGLSDMSSDADIAAAQDAVDAAQAALDATTVLSVTDVRAMQAKIDGAQTSLNMAKSDIDDYRMHQSQLSAADTAVGAAAAAVDGLSAASSDADVDAADVAVAAADAAVAAGTMLTAAEKASLNSRITLAKVTLANKKSQISDRKDQDERDAQYALVSGAIASAVAAVDALTAMSSDTDVAAAEDALAAAQAALGAATVLSASDVFALQGQINAAQTSLATAKSLIGDYNTHKGQLAAANGAVDAAETAVGGLSEMSTDDEVDAAKDAVAAAEAAVAAGTLLTDAEKEGLNADISAAKTSLASAEADIADYRTHQSELAAANGAVDAATAAVNGLSAASTDADAEAADAAVAAAKAAVAAGTMLTAAEVAALNSRISLAEANLVNKKTLISDRQDQDERDAQYASVSDAIDAATAAIAGLTTMSSDADVAAAQALVDDAQAALDDTTVLEARDVRALQTLVSAAQANLDKAESDIADYNTHKSQLATANGAVDSATSAVGALSVDSTDAEVDAADEAIAAAKAAVAAGTLLTAAETASLNTKIRLAESDLRGTKLEIAERKAQDKQDAELELVSGAIEAADTAIDGLTDMSSDAEVATAQSAIDSAQDALDDSEALSASQGFKLQGQINRLQTSLDTAKSDIADYREHQKQYTAAKGAIDTAAAAVAGLNAMSTDAEVDAADMAIAAARKALSDGTALTAEERTALSGELSTAETDLGNVKSDIADRKTHENQLEAANTAVKDATAAVNDLTEMSSDDDVAAAKTAIASAEAAVTAGTMLTAGETAALNGEIAIAKVNLTTKEMAIKNYNTHKTQLAAATKDVNDAVAAVDGLDVDSTDAEVEAAEDAITEAKAAIAAGTSLTAAEVAELNGKIAAAETSLKTVVAQIDLRKQRDIAETVARLHGVASKATTDAAAAAKAAGEAEGEAAKHAAMLSTAAGTFAVSAAATHAGGDSATVTANAAAVMNAKTAVDTAAQDATTAKENAQAAKTTATGLPEDTTGRQALIDALDGAITAAKGHIDTITAIRDTEVSVAGSVKQSVQTVQGSDKKNLKAAADRGKQVAEHIDASLAATGDAPTRVNSNVSGTAIASFDTVPDAAEASDTTSVAVKRDDGQGMTWLEIGGSSLMDKRIAAGAPTGTASHVVKAKSMADMKADDVFGTIPSNFPAGSAAGQAVADGTEYNDADAADDPVYNGIRGVLFCAGSDCKVEGTLADRKLVGSWYFTADDVDQSYVADAANPGSYVAETVYARFGHWLSVVSNNVWVNAYALAGTDNITDSMEFTKISQTGFPDDKATYNGDAVGMSVRKTSDANLKVISIASGQFEADVSLTMQFGAAPRLNGTISNFRGGAHVDPSWSVDLKGPGENFTGAFTSGITNDDGTAATTNEGSWSAQAYAGDPFDHDNDTTTDAVNPRPAGVFGTFDAYFTNGSMAGAYSTRCASNCK